MKFPSTENKAKIIEVFSSIQGEGTCQGERHLFIRFEECHMHCVYCDELGKPARAWSMEELLNEVDRLETEEGSHEFISLTGGEPLLYLPFIKPLIQYLKARGHKIYLETSGVLWQALGEVIEDCDYVSMDMKAPSVTKEKNYDLEHRKFLEIAKQKETAVKIIVSHDLLASEFEEELSIVRDIAPKVPVILMPISTEIEGHEDFELMAKIKLFQALGQDYVDDIRIVTRLHKILQIR